MSKYIALDIGNVLLEVDIQSMIDRLSQFVAGGYLPEIKKEIALSTLERIQASHDIGLLNFKHAMEEFLIRQDIGYSLGQEALSKGADHLVSCWNEIIQLNKHMINFLKKLKENNVQIALLSNMGKEHYQYIKKMYPEIFSDSIEFISFQVGARKPTKLYYNLFIQEHPEFKHALYLDDIQENLDASAKYLNPFKFDLNNLINTKKLNKTINLILNQYIAK